MLAHHESIRYEYDKVSFDEPLSYGAYKIYQLGDICTDASYHCGVHKQMCHELTYVIKGEADIVLNDKTVRVKAGDLIYSPRDSIHDIYSRSDDYNSHYIGFMIEGGVGEDKELEDYYNNLPCGVISGIKSVKYAFYNILINMFNNDEFSTKLLTESIRGLFISSLRSFRGGRDWQYSPEHGSEHSIMISRVCAYISETLDNRDALKELPDHFNYSYSHISNVFSKAMNMSLKEYSMKLRYDKACELLRDGVSVTDVAERVGYSSIHAFSHFFTKREGVAPGIYQRRIKSGGDL